MLKPILAQCSTEEETNPNGCKKEKKEINLPNI
jgi:hypothetical protein